MLFINFKISLKVKAAKILYKSLKIKTVQVVKFLLVLELFSLVLEENDKEMWKKLL